MKQKSAFLILSMLACFAALFCFDPVDAKASENEEVLRVCGQLFGKSVDDKLNLFEVNRFYVLRVAFDKHNNLEQLEVVPKFHFEETHPDWNRQMILLISPFLNIKNYWCSSIQSNRKACWSNRHHLSAS